MVHKEVAELAFKIMTEDYGNPSSMHHKGVVAENYIKEAKKKIAKTLKADEKEILFTSGGTESDNMAIIGVARAMNRKGKHLITTMVEHPAVLETMKYLEKEGFEVTYLPVDRHGLINIDELKAAIREDTVLVSIMMVNNEIGALEPIAEAGKAIKETNPDTYFHVDAVQGYGKVMINPRNMNIDLMSVSSHKIHGPKGIGFLYIKNGTKIVPINYGGGQQKGLRSGTENVPGIAGLGLAAQMAYENFDDDIEKLYKLKEYFINTANEKLSDISFNGFTDRNSAPHIISMSVKGVRAEVLLHALEDKGIYVSAGSACASNAPHVSATLKGIGLESDLLDSTVRISMSTYTTQEELDYTINSLCDIVGLLRKFRRM